MVSSTSFGQLPDAGAISNSPQHYSSGLFKLARWASGHAERDLFDHPRRRCRSSGPVQTLQLSLPIHHWLLIWQMLSVQGLSQRDYQTVFVRNTDKDCHYFTSRPPPVEDGSEWHPSLASGIRIGTIFTYGNGVGVCLHHHHAMSGDILLNQKYY